MNQQIKTFLAIAEQKTISGASRVLHYSTASISLYLTQLEKHLGVQLVLRTKGKREVTLTPAGETFLPLAQRYMDVDRQINQFILAQQKRVLRLAASKISHEYIVSHIAHKFLRRSHGVELLLSTVEIKEMSRAIEMQSFDVGLMFGPVPKHPFVSAIPLYEEERCILCPSNTPLPDRLISPQELDPAFEIFFTGYQPGAAVPTWREKYLPGEHKPFFKVSLMMTGYNYMTDPRCWMIFPISTAHNIMALYPGQFTIRSLDPAPDTRICSAVVLQSCNDTKAVQDLLCCIDEYIAERPYLKKLQG